MNVRTSRGTRASDRMLVATVLLAAMLAGCAGGGPIRGFDKNAAGAWELAVSGGRWLWTIDSSGAYQFHSEAPDGVAPHSGKVSANGKAWALAATNGYSDGGSYAFRSHDTLVATGKLGTGNWHRLPDADNDANTLGTWDLSVNGERWVWEMDMDGGYKFHSEPANGTAPHDGTFRAGHGYWWLEATNGYVDGGTYTFRPPDTLIATGRLGTARWHRPENEKYAPCEILSAEATINTGEWYYCAESTGARGVSGPPPKKP